MMVEVGEIHWHRILDVKFGEDGVVNGGGNRESLVSIVSL